MYTVKECALQLSARWMRTLEDTYYKGEAEGVWRRLREIITRNLDASDGGGLQHRSAKMQIQLLRESFQNIGATASGAGGTLRVHIQHFVEALFKMNLHDDEEAQDKDDHSGD